MSEQGGFQPFRGSPADANPAWTPPVAIGAPPMIPSGVHLNHGHSMMPSPQTQTGSTWTPPVAHGRQTPLPDGISLPVGGGSMMNEMVPKKKTKEQIPHKGHPTQTPDKTSESEPKVTTNPEPKPTDLSKPKIAEVLPAEQSSTSTTLASMLSIAISLILLL